MNDIRIKELNNLNTDYHAGSTRDVLYRCSLLGPFVMAAAPEFPEYNLSEIKDAMLEWFDICDDNNLELVESLVELYTFDTINNTPLRFYEQFPELFERMVDYLVAKITWQPSTEEHNLAVDSSNNLTAELLNNIYFNK